MTSLFGTPFWAYGTPFLHSWLLSTTYAHHIFLHDACIFLYDVIIRDSFLWIRDPFLSIRDSFLCIRDSFLLHMHVTYFYMTHAYLYMTSLFGTPFWVYGTPFFRYGTPFFAFVTPFFVSHMQVTYQHMTSGLDKTRRWRLAHDSRTNTNIKIASRTPSLSLTSLLSNCTATGQKSAHNKPGSAHNCEGGRMTQPAFLPSSLCYTTNLHYITLH